jgi:hypothetical protein
VQPFVRQLSVQCALCEPRECSRCERLGFGRRCGSSCCCITEEISHQHTPIADGVSPSDTQSTPGFPPALCEGFGTAGQAGSLGALTRAPPDQGTVGSSTRRLLGWWEPAATGEPLTGESEARRLLYAAVMLVAAAAAFPPTAPAPSLAAWKSTPVKRTLTSLKRCAKSCVRGHLHDAPPATHTTLRDEHHTQNTETPVSVLSEAESGDELAATASCRVRVRASPQRNIAHTTAAGGPVLELRDALRCGPCESGARPRTLACPPPRGRNAFDSAASCSTAPSCPWWAPPCARRPIR